MEEEDDPISMKSMWFPSETEGKRGRSLRVMTCSSFCDGQVNHNSYPKKYLTTSKTVTYVGGEHLFKLRDQPSNH